MLGAVLRLWQYLAAPSMWLDELALIQNVMDRPLWALLSQPLAFNQVAPKGLLAVEKGVLLGIGPHDYAFRLFPLASGLFALLLFRKLAKLLLAGYGPVVAVALFAVAGSLVDYTSRAKQYSSDVAAAVLLLWLAADLERNGISLSRMVRATIIGLIAVVFSQAAVLTLVGLGGALALREFFRRDRAEKKLVTVLLICWAAIALSITAVSLAGMQSDTRSYLHGYWSGGFAPHTWSMTAQLRWPLRRLTELIGSASPASLGYPFPLVYIVLALFGVWSLWRLRREDALLVVLPGLVALVAGYARQYPFNDRMILFILPGFFLALGAAAESIRRKLVSIAPLAASVAVIAIAVPAMYPTLRTLPPYRIEDMKPVLSHVRDHRLPGDSVYVYYGAGPAMRFYGGNYGIQLADFRQGGCYKGETSQYFREVDAFRGKPRVWVMITGAADKYGERKDIERYLDEIGSREDALLVPSKTVAGDSPVAEVLLYDLSIPDRLAKSSASEFKATGRDTRTCQGPYSMVQGEILPSSGALPK